MHWETKKFMILFIAIFVLLQQPGTETAVSLRYACNILSIQQFSCFESTVGPQYPWVPTAENQSDTKGQLYYIILYKGLEQPQILVSEGGPGTNSLWISRDNCN